MEKHISALQEEWKNANVEDWKFIFEKLYGATVDCQLCGRQLQWDGTKTEIVYWDHCKGYNHVPKPHGWLRNHKCNISNMKIWLSLGFGKLCRDCNLKLPTEGRVDFLEKALNYAKKMGV